MKSSSRGLGGCALLFLACSSTSGGPTSMAAGPSAAATPPENLPAVDQPASTPEPPAAQASEQGTALGNTESTPDLPLAPPTSMEPPAAMAPNAPAPTMTCAIVANPTPPAAGEVNVDLTSELQAISGFGGISVPAWIADLTPAQVDTAFGNGPGQIGMSILRIRIPYDSNQFAKELPTAVRAVSYGAKIMATPWTPPPEMKSSNALVGGALNANSYDAYADHLTAFRDFMQQNGVPIYAMSVQNEPDYEVQYESCQWSAAQLTDWITAEGAKFGATKLIAAESVKFDRAVTDPILQDENAAPLVGIVGGHIYGGGLSDYPLARSLGKEVWMTEHYRNSSNSSNDWPLALDVGKEIHDVMSANFSAYVWWYIRRAYGPITEDGQVSKVGYLMAQYSKFVRPGFTRIAATAPASTDVHVTAYKNDANAVVIVAVNMSAQPQKLALSIYNGCAASLARFTTSGTKNVEGGDTLPLAAGRASATLDAQSVTTFVSQ